MKSQIPSSTKRLAYLDSIRGIAACMVLFFHCYMNSVNFLDGGITVAFLSVPNFIHYIIEKVIGSGRAAVMVFFLLSGFVLTYSLEKHPSSYAGFIVKRFFRIYPVFVLTILISYVLHWLIGYRHEVGCKALMGDLLNIDLTPLTLLKHLVLWGTQNSIRLDGAIWTLVHEMRISLIFPFIILSVRKFHVWAVLGYFLLSVACAVLAWYLTGRIVVGQEETSIGLSLMATCYFIVIFSLGVLLALKREKIAKKVSNLPRWGKILTFLIVAACLMKSHRDASSLWAITTDYISAVGAFGVISLALGVQKFRSVLNHRTPIWLGRISYSLYLIHSPILYAVIQTTDALWLGISLSLVVIALSVISAELMARLVEFPAIRLGKRVVRSF